MVSVTNGDTGLLNGSLLGERSCSTGSIHHKGAARHGTRSRNRQQRSKAPSAQLGRRMRVYRQEQSYARLRMQGCVAVAAQSAQNGAAPAAIAISCGP